MKTILRRFGLMSATALLLFCGTVEAVPAANTNGSANGYKVSPVRSDLTINPGASQTITVYVQNVSDVTEDLKTIVNDFQAGSDETGTPALLLNGQNAPAHGLKQYVTIPAGNFTLKPNEQRTVSVRVSLPKTIAAGGYFGAVRFAPAASAPGKIVNLSASVASLVLVRVPGDVKEQLSIASFDVRSGDQPHTVFVNSKSLSGVVRFQNNGDVQEEPFGKVELKKGSKLLGTYEINNTDPPGNVLPDSIRKFSVGLNKVGSFGKYTLTGNFGYGNNSQLLSASTSFYVVPIYAFIIIIAVILLLLFAVLVLPRLIRSYNQRVIARASARSQRGSRRK